MSTESLPPPSSGGNAKYAIVGVLLLLAAGGVWFATRGPSEPPANQVVVVTRDAGSVEPPPAENLDIEIPDPEPDMGPPADASPAKTKIVYRYVREGASWDCSGNIPAEPAARVFAEARTQMRSCYERRLRANNTLQGNAVVRVRVGRSGEVDAVNVGGSLRDSETFSCMRAIAERLRFQPPAEGSCAVLQQPFSFTPQN